MPFDFFNAIRIIRCIVFQILQILLILAIIWKWIVMRNWCFTATLFSQNIYYRTPNLTQKEAHFALQPFLCSPLLLVFLRPYLPFNFFFSSSLLLSSLRMTFFANFEVNFCTIIFSLCLFFAFLLLFYLSSLFFLFLSFSRYLFLVCILAVVAAADIKSYCVAK